jgi:hypothetical protein
MDVVRSRPVCISSDHLSKVSLSAAPRVVSTCLLAEYALVRPLLSALELSCCYLPLLETSRSVSHAFTCVAFLGADPPSVLQSPNLGGGLYHNNRTGGVDSCIFAGNTVTLDFSGQVWPSPTLGEQM